MDWNTPLSPSIPPHPRYRSTHLYPPKTEWPRQPPGPMEATFASRAAGCHSDADVLLRTPEKEGAAPPQIWTSCPDSNDFHLKLQRYKTLSGALEPFLPERRCQNHLLVHRRGTSNITAAVIETHIEIWRLHSWIACRILFLLRLHFLDRSVGLFFSLPLFFCPLFSWKR